MRDWWVELEDNSKYWIEKIEEGEWMIHFWKFRIILTFKSWRKNKGESKNETNSNGN